MTGSSWNVLPLLAPQNGGTLLTLAFTVLIRLALLFMPSRKTPEGCRNSDLGRFADGALNQRTRA